MIIHGLEGVGWYAVQAWRLLIFQFCYKLFDLVPFDLVIEFLNYPSLFQNFEYVPVHNSIVVEDFFQVEGECTPVTFIGYEKGNIR